LGSDSVLATISEFPATGVEVNTFIGVVGAIRGVIGPTWEISENFVDGRYELGVYDTSIPTGSQIFAYSNGAGLTSRDLTSNSTGYPVYALYGSTYVDDSGVTSRVQTGKDIVDYVQNGTSISVPNFIGTGLDDFSAGGDYTGAYTGSYSVTVIGNNGNRVLFNAGMTTGDHSQSEKLLLVLFQEQQLRYLKEQAILVSGFTTFQVHSYLEIFLQEVVEMYQQPLQRLEVQMETCLK